MNPEVTGSPADPSEPLQPDSIVTQKEKLFPYQDGQGPLRSISGRWLRRVQGRRGGRGAPPPTKERGERDRSR